MSRTLFENSKAALAFAAVTIIGAVSMVGTSEDRGVLPAVADRLASIPAKGESGGGDTASQGGGQGQASEQPRSLFGDYTAPPAAPADAKPDPAPPAAVPPRASGSSTPGGSSGGPMNAPLSPGAIVTTN